MPAPGEAPSRSLALDREYEPFGSSEVSDCYSAHPAAARWRSSREVCFRGTGHSFHGSGWRSRRTKEYTSLTCGYAEPPIGIEPMTYALREASFSSSFRVRQRRLRWSRRRECFSGGRPGRGCRITRELYLSRHRPDSIKDRYANVLCEKRSYWILNCGLQIPPLRL